VVAVGKTSVADGAIIVAVGMICSVADATVVAVRVGTSTVILDINVEIGSTRTLKRPQAVRGSNTIKIRNFLAFIEPPVQTCSLYIV
jgi:hypothetical protein